MSLDSLTAKANTGSGVDVLAGRQTPNGFAGAVLLLDTNGNEHTLANPVPTRLLGVSEFPLVETTSTSGVTHNGVYSVCITNIGAAAGTVLGASIPAGISINLVPRAGNNVATFAYDATGTTFLIVYMTDGNVGGGGQ